MLTRCYYLPLLADFRNNLEIFNNIKLIKDILKLLDFYLE